MERLALLLRPLGIAFGVYILLNLSLALQRPGLAVTTIWLDASLDEPWLSLFAAVLGFALLIPHELGRIPWVRTFTGGAFAGFAIIAFANTLGFYLGLGRGEVVTDFPLPLSVLVLAILLVELYRALRWAPRQPLVPAPARVFFFAVGTAVSFLLLTLAHVVTYGHRDFRGKADAAVVLGAKVHSDGRPSDALVERLETGIELYSQGLVERLIFTGATDPNGQEEPTVMRDYAVRRKIPPTAIILDAGGVNTRESARNVRALARERGFKKVLAVTQYFHCARVKMIFEREGVACATVPTCAAQAGSARLSGEAFYLLREAVAFPFYLLYYR